MVRKESAGHNSGPILRYVWDCDDVEEAVAARDPYLVSRALGVTLSATRRSRSSTTNRYAT